MKKQIDQLFAHVRQGVTVILDNHSVPHTVHDSLVSNLTHQHCAVSSLFLVQLGGYNYSTLDRIRLIPSIQGVGYIYRGAGSLHDAMTRAQASYFVIY